MLPSRTIESRRTELIARMGLMVFDLAMAAPDELSMLEDEYEACEKELDLLSKQEQEFDNWWKIGKES
jgi:hypothetical protein